MRLTKKLTGIKGVGFEKVLNYERAIKKNKENKDETKELFNKVKKSLKDKEYDEADKYLRMIYFEIIPKEFYSIISLLTDNEIEKLFSLAFNEYLNIGEQGFHTLVYLKVKVMCNGKSKNSRR